MASFTKYLNLLKKDPVADGADTFNIETMLNENWDKIDAEVSKTNSSLSNKAEWNASDLTSGSIKHWAESQKTNTTIAANEGASDLPYIGYWAVEFYLWTSGQWRILVATDVQTNARYYCVKNSDNAWSDWIPEATATPPQEYALPLAEGWTVIPEHAATYSKNQFDQITIVLGLSTAKLQTSEKTVFTLPIGFRPGKAVTASAIFWSASTGAHGSVLVLSPDGQCVLFHQVGVGESGNLHGTFTFQCND